MKKSEIVFGLLRIPMDFAMVVLGFLLGYKIRLNGDFIPGMHFPLNLDSFPPVNEYVILVLYFAATLVIVFAIFGLYQLKNTEGPLREGSRVVLYSFVWILLIIAYFFAVRQVFFSRLVLGFSFVIAVAFMLSARLFLRSLERLLLLANIGVRRVLIIGSNKITARMLSALGKDPHYCIVGYLSKTGTKIKDMKRLGSLKNLKEVVTLHQVEEIIQTSDKLTEIQAHDILEFCREHHLDYRFIPDILEIDRTNVEVEPIAGLPLIHIKPTPLDGWGKVIKRSYDFLGSLMGLLLLSPILILIAIGIKIDSKGPTLFTKLDDNSPANRVGQGGKLFKFYKFRTMKHNSHSLRYSELAKQNNRKGPLVKIKNDPRITKFGRFLRRTSLDELPQLWNVLKGNMSLVGPRPHLPEEVEDYEKHHKFLLTIKPGITGLSQINGRSDLDFDEEVRLDTFYIKHWSPFLDLKILLKTIFVVLRGKAAD